VDPAEQKERQRMVWGLGEYAGVSRLLEPAAVALCEACGVSAGQEVLDVGAGDGNFVLAAARSGARVVATDLAPGMVERGRARTEAEGYRVEWREADAESLPFEDDRFDCVGSVFGAMIAPRPEVAARELLRVVRPGGVVGMTAWTPDSFLVKVTSIMRKYQPPTGLPAPEEWGEEETARRRFRDLPASFEFQRRTLTWEVRSVDELVELEQSTPPAAALRSALDDEQWERMLAEQRELFDTWSGGGDGPLSIEAEYALMVARKPG
jgi:ubiquinone/menaquinone biosynthesis C-methylase UbiE